MTPSSFVRAAGARLLLALLWLLHWLPLALLAPLGHGLGLLLYAFARSRRHVALRNLELCLPQFGPADRARVAREHFQWLGRSILERGVLWHASRRRLKRLIHVEGGVQFAQQCDRPVMWLVPHFIALDVAGAATQLFQSRQVASIYQQQSEPTMDAAIRRGRLRFGQGEVFPRSDSARPLLRAVRGGAAFFNLPDMDFGARDAAFVPFFGVAAATLLAPSRMARAMNMVVQPVIARILPGGQGYRVTFLEPWSDFPSADPLADTARMNRWIEAQVRADPAQYLWVHRRFKTRPPGEPPLY
jgi:Kdo2-lipid IVA lauroyltransferase/acyltransferase